MERAETGASSRATHNLHRRAKPFRHGDEFGCRAQRVQASLVGDCDDRVRTGGPPSVMGFRRKAGRSSTGRHHSGQGVPLVRQPCRTTRGDVLRQLARRGGDGIGERLVGARRVSGIGRFTPAITSTPLRSIIEMARLDRPPNISVSNPTPSPVSHRPIQATISARLLSTSSSRPNAHGVHATLRMGERAPWRDRSSSARRPWVTRIMPIICCRTVPTGFPDGAYPNGEPTVFGAIHDLSQASCA